MVVCATCSEATALPAPLRSPGRLDSEVALPLPGAAGRLGMLTAELAARGLTASSHDLEVLTTTSVAWRLISPSTSNTTFIYLAVCDQNMSYVMRTAAVEIRSYPCHARRVRCLQFRFAAKLYALDALCRAVRSGNSSLHKQSRQRKRSPTKGC